MKTIRIAATAALAATSLFAMSACANPSVEAPESSADPATSTAITDATCNPELQAMLSADLRDRDELRVATNAPFPPYIEFKSAGSKELVGIDVDLGTAIGQKLCVPLTFAQQPFDGLITGLEAGKYDIVMAGVFASPERAKAVRFTTYSQSGTAIMVQAGNTDIATLDDLCGRSVATQNGATQMELLNTQSEQCVSAGLEALTIQQFPQFSDERLALMSGKVDAVVHDLQALVAGAEGEAGLEVITDPEAPGGYDIQRIAAAVNMDRPELQEAIRAALAELQDDGIYDEIFTKWGAESTRVETPEAYGATS